MLVARRHLYLTAALVWGVPGLTITIKGLLTYCKVSQSQLWWLYIVTLCVVVAFFFIFRSIVKRYINRIATLSERSFLYNTFPPKGWVLILFMMMLGIALKNIPHIPLQFTASFYSGLGPMLIVSSLRYLFAMSNSR